LAEAKLIGAVILSLSIDRAYFHVEWSYYHSFDKVISFIPGHNRFAHHRAAMEKLVQYIPRSLQTFPTYLDHHIHHARNPWSFIEYYQNAPDSIHTIMPLFWTSITLTYFLGLVTGNVSQIGESNRSSRFEPSLMTSLNCSSDRQWTFLPIAYSLHFVLYPLFNNINGDELMHNLPRLCLMWSLMVSLSPETL